VEDASGKGYIAQWGVVAGGNSKEGGSRALKIHALEKMRIGSADINNTGKGKKRENGGKTGYKNTWPNQEGFVGGRQI